ncbi:hypothetical protein GJ496_007486, partial [Pomphorhynchus laevis]
MHQYQSNPSISQHYFESLKSTSPYRYHTKPSASPYLNSAKPTTPHQYRTNPFASRYIQSDLQVKPTPLHQYQANPFAPPYFQSGHPTSMHQCQANPSVPSYVQSALSTFEEQHQPQSYSSPHYLQQNDNMPTLNAGQSQFYPTYDFQLANTNYRPCRDMYYPAGFINPFINQCAMPTYPGYIMPQCQKNINTISSNKKHPCPIHGRISKNIFERRIESEYTDEQLKKMGSSREDEDKIKKK